MASELPVRFGILGCAEIARKVSRAIRLAPNACLYAVGSRSVDKASKFASDNGFPPSAKIYGSYDAVLDDPDVDAVYVPLPTSLHVKWAVAAAQKKKHLLLEKPVALNAKELETILEACESNGVQFMDSTMWMHHPRTAKMREFLSDSHRFGELKSIHSCFTFGANPDFLENDIRVKPDLDALGALGDVGWYCIRAILWAADFHLPKSVTALRGPIFNKSGVVLSCGSTLFWENGKTATFHCSFLSNLTMDLFQRGSCHYGDRCKFLHVIQQPSKANSFGFGLQNGTQFHRANSHSQTPNPFGLGVQNSSQPRAANNFGSQFKHFENKWTRGSSKETGNSAPSQQTDNQPPAPTHKCTDPESCKRQIIEDLENEKPLWTLTCYGHCKNGPCDITGDISYEELRAVAYDDAKRGLSLQSIVERERSLLNSKLLEFENLRRDPYILPNSTISMQSSFPGTRPPVLAQNVSPPSVSSFSQLGASLDTSSITRTTAPGNNAFGQPSPFQNSASVDSKHPIQSFGSSFGSSIASFGNNSIKVEGNPLFASAVSQPKLSGFSLVGQTTAGFHSMHNSQSQNGTEENSIWSKEEWYPGEVPEEAPPGVDSY